MSRQELLKVGPINILVEQRGRAVPIVGHYAQAGPDARPDAVLRVDLSENFPTSGPAPANYPAFQTTRVGATTLALSRLDARGTLDFRPLEPISAQFEGLARPHVLEAAIRVAASAALPRNGGLLMHSSAVQDGRGAHVFSGVSGAGKSTIARLLTSHYPVELLSDELLLLVRDESGWSLEVAPFTGKVTLPWGHKAPLASIDLLAQAPCHRRTALTPAETIAELLRHVVSYAQDPPTLMLLLDLVADLVKSTPCYRLEFENSGSVGEVLDLTCS